MSGVFVREERGEENERRNERTEISFSPFGGRPPPRPQAFREGGEDGVVEGLALSKSGALPLRSAESCVGKEVSSRN